MKEADVDRTGVKDIARIMRQNCFTDPALKAKLRAVKTPTLDVFNDIIESHEAGKRAVNMSATANAIKRRNNKSKESRSSSNNTKKQISNAEGQRRQKIIKKCFRCGKASHMMPSRKFSSTVECNSCNNLGHISAASKKRNSASSANAIIIFFGFHTILYGLSKL